MLRSGTKGHPTAHSRWANGKGVTVPPVPWDADRLSDLYDGPGGALEVDRGHAVHAAGDAAPDLAGGVLGDADQQGVAPPEPWRPGRAVSGEARRVSFGSCLASRTA